MLNGKPPILLIHGFVSSVYTFNRLMPLLINNFSVIAIDLPGFGRSEKSKTFIYSFANYAKLIDECLQYFKLKNVTIIGHSMGGQIALYTAKLTPYKIKKLILLCSSGYLKSAKKSLIYCSYLPFSRFFVERYIRKKDIKMSLENVFYNKSYITDELMEEFTKPLTEKDFYTSLLRLLRYREGDLTSEELREIQIPTLLIWGEEDKVVPLEIGQRLLQDLPNAELITYEKTGHLVTEERPNDLYHDIMSYSF
jgi:pimeloyl-ACP methyl ester carboxylesterase